jgi:large subunit ribosomal protein L23
MGIFGSKNDEDKENGSEKTEVQPDKDRVGKVVITDYSSVILRPRITEKASFKFEVNNAYVFEIAKDADKKKVEKAVLEIYKVKPVKVNIVKNPSKRVFVRGKRGVKSGVKKAYVYLKEGDKIEII